MGGDFGSRERKGLGTRLSVARPSSAFMRCSRGRGEASAARAEDLQ